MSHYAYAQPQAHVGFDNVRIGGGKYYLGFEMLFTKGIIQARAPGKAKDVSNNRMLRDVFNS